VIEKTFTNGLTAAQAERLALLLEEMGEAQQVVGKILRHGYLSRNPRDQSSIINRCLLESEIADVLFAVRFLVEAGDIYQSEIDFRQRHKAGKIGPYLHHQTSIPSVTVDEPAPAETASPVPLSGTSATPCACGNPALPGEHERWSCAVWPPLPAPQAVQGTEGEGAAGGGEREKAIFDRWDGLMKKLAEGPHGEYVHSLEARLAETMGSLAAAEKRAQAAEAERDELVGLLRGLVEGCHHVSTLTMSDDGYDIYQAALRAAQEALDESVMSYWKANDCWCLYLPGCGVGTLSNHQVTEHDDGTITVSPSILVTGHESGQRTQRHGYLERGVWRDA